MVFDGSNRALMSTVKAYVEEGYAGNATVFACVQRLMKAAASVELRVEKTEKDGKRAVVDAHPVLKLLNDPNPTQEGSLFLQELVMWHRIAGEAFVMKVEANKKPAELYCLDPRMMEVVPREGSLIPKEYRYGNGDKKRVFKVDAITGASDIMHIRTPNPLNAWRGLSPLAAGARSADVSNEGLKWNASLLGNGARPSGVLTMEGNPTDETTVNRLRKWFKEAYQGSSAAGEVPLLTGGIAFTPLSTNPKDMDFEKSIAMADKNIAQVYGVPLPLVTMEAATFSNMETAMELLWTDTVLPLLGEIIESLSDFLMPAFADKEQTLELCFNADSVPALEGRRTRLYERMEKAVGAGLLTINEARREMGLEPDADANADKLLVPGTLKLLESAAQASEPTTALVDTMKKAGFSDADIAKTLRRDFGLKEAA